MNEINRKSITSILDNLDIFGKGMQELDTRLEGIEEKYRKLIIEETEDIRKEKASLEKKATLWKGLLDSYDKDEVTAVRKERVGIKANNDETTAGLWNDGMEETPEEPAEEPLETNEEPEEPAEEPEEEPEDEAEEFQDNDNTVTDGESSDGDGWPETADEWI